MKLIKQSFIHTFIDGDATPQQLGVMFIVFALPLGVLMLHFAKYLR